MNKFIDGIRTFITSTKKYMIENILFEKVLDNDIKITYDRESAIFPLEKFNNIIKNHKGSVTYKTNKFKMHGISKKTGKVLIELKLNNKEYQINSSAYSEEFYGLFFYLSGAKVYLSIKGFTKYNKNKNYDFVLTPDEDNFLLFDGGYIPSKIFMTSGSDMEEQEIIEILDFIKSDELARKNTYIGITCKTNINLENYKELNIKIFDKVAGVGCEKLMKNYMDYDLEIRDFCSIEAGFGIINNKCWKKYNMKRRIENLKIIEYKIMKKEKESNELLTLENYIDYDINNIKYFEKSGLKFIEEKEALKLLKSKMFKNINTKKFIKFLFLELEKIKEMHKENLKNNPIFQEYILFHLFIAEKSENEKIIKFLFEYMKNNNLLFLNKLQSIKFIFSIPEKDYLEWIINFIYDNYDLSISVFKDYNFTSVSDYILMNELKRKFTVIGKNIENLTEKDIEGMLWCDYLSPDKKEEIIKKYLAVIKGNI